MWLALSPPNPPSYRDEHLYVDLSQRVVILDGRALTLYPLEYRLLALLVKSAGEVVPRKTLLMQTWGHAELRANVLDVHIRRLRSKLGKYADHYIERVPRVGYRFRPLLVLLCYKLADKAGDNLEGSIVKVR